MSTIQSVTYEGGAAVTVSDTTADAAGVFAALQATTAAGLAKVQMIDGSTVTVYLPLGVIVPVAVSRVWSTGTAATGIVGLRSPPYKQVINPGAGVISP